MSEKPMEDSNNRFIGKTIVRLDATCCNNLVFSFSDGSRVAIHIEVNNIGLPDLVSCTDCA